MNCWRGECKFNKNGVCEVDSKPCDMTSERKIGYTDYHCRQENNKALRGSDPDTAMAIGLPEDAYLLPFWSCQNICRFYDTCTET